MESTVRQYLPHAPQMGLYVAPGIPPKLLAAARKAFGGALGEDALALYDATRLGTARDGALFGATAFCFQNLIEAPQRVAYTSLIRVWPEKKLLSGASLHMEVNRARALFTLQMDFSARGDALPYVQRFLEAAIAHSTDRELEVEETGEAPADASADAALDLLEKAAGAGTLTAAQQARLRLLAGRG